MYSYALIVCMCQLVATNGKTLDVAEGVIRAWRHVHLNRRAVGDAAPAFAA